MGKVERMRPRPSDGRAGVKEGSEDHVGTKGSRADGVGPRAPSPGKHGPYSKSTIPQDYKVRLLKEKTLKDAPYWV